MSGEQRTKLILKPPYTLPIQLRVLRPQTPMCTPMGSSLPKPKPLVSNHTQTKGGVVNLLVAPLF